MITTITFEAGDKVRYKGLTEGPTMLVKCTYKPSDGGRQAVGVVWFDTTHNFQTRDFYMDELELENREFR